ncbi:dihydrouridine synthase, partial [Neisseria gonorrhoeae]
MHIGGYFIDNPIALAPMAGITDKPFRRLCRAFGAGWAVCEMLASDPTLRNTGKTLHRSDFADEGGIVAVQIAGSDPEQMADAARYNVGLGAQVIDINMGCPAKKVCNVQAGSALMQDEPLVAAILEAVVKAAGVPVTLKTRLGWHDDHQNLPAIAKIAED